MHRWHAADWWPYTADGGPKSLTLTHRTTSTVWRRADFLFVGRFIALTVPCLAIVLARRETGGGERKLKCWYCRLGSYFASCLCGRGFEGRIWRLSGFHGDRVLQLIRETRV